MRLTATLVCAFAVASSTACGPVPSTDAGGDAAHLDAPIDASGGDATRDAFDSGTDSSLDVTTMDTASDATIDTVTADVVSDDATDANVVDVAVDVTIVPQCDAVGTVQVVRDQFDIAPGFLHAAVVWIEPPSTLRAGFFERDATIRGTRTINGAPNAGLPRIARTTSGWAIVWTDGAEISYQRLDHDLVPIGTPMPIRTGTGSDYRPRVVASGDDLAITWFNGASSDLELWIASVSATGVISTPMRLSTAAFDVSLTATGDASWSVLFPDRAAGATSAATLVPFTSASGLGTPVVLAPIALTNRIAWTGVGYLTAGLFGTDEYVETYSTSAVRTSQRHFAPSGTTSGSVIDGDLAASFGAFAHPICMPNASGGGSSIQVLWFAADGTSARADGPTIAVPGANCARPTIATMGPDFSALGWADNVSAAHDLSLRVLCR